jgi:hypothetical protein
MNRNYTSPGTSTLKMYTYFVYKVWIRYYTATIIKERP